QSDTAPGTDGAVFDAFTVLDSTHGINASGQMTFKQNLRVGSGNTAVVAANQPCLWTTASGPSGNSLGLIARASDSVPGLSGVTYTGTSSFASASPQAFNNGGRLVYEAKLAGASVTTGVNDEVLMTWTNGGGSSVLFRTGDAAPGSLGAAG